MNPKPENFGPAHLRQSRCLARVARRAALLPREPRFRSGPDGRNRVILGPHGTVTDRRIESRLVTDRGDGLRGSTREPNKGKRAVTHVRAVEALDGATLCEVRLETGKTHQIRIHLSESGHPLVGERVYIRDFGNRGGEPIESRRLLLHAATLGFRHPITGVQVRCESPLPQDFRDELDCLRL